MRNRRVNTWTVESFILSTYPLSLPQLILLRCLFYMRQAFSGAAVPKHGSNNNKPGLQYLGMLSCASTTHYCSRSGIHHFLCVDLSLSKTDSGKETFGMLRTRLVFTESNEHMKIFWILNVRKNTRQVQTHTAKMQRILCLADAMHVSSTGMTAVASLFTELHQTLHFNGSSFSSLVTVSSWTFSYETDSGAPDGALSHSNILISRPNM